MLVNGTLPRGVEEWNESRSTSQPAESEESVEVMCWSKEERIREKTLETVCGDMTITINTLY